jgi:glycosyltransferase involved in cell wall biosynthesis
MKILFTLAHGYPPQGYGGLQKTTDQLSRELMKKGHRVAVLASLMHGGRFALISRIKLKANQIFRGHRLSRDTTLGYPVWRTWFPWGRAEYFPEKEIRYVIGKEKPDLIVVSSGELVHIALIAKSTGIPILISVVDVEFQDHSGSFRELGDIPCVANSRFTADKHRDAFGVNPSVIYPLMPLEEYRTETTRENVTFINPSPHKGLRIALEIARRCPEIPFVFNENWPSTAKQREEFARKHNISSNVVMVPSQEDMRNVYGKCKILLAPSEWKEGYGRIATEAQVSGIPVVASARGGLPEAVGPGGVVLDPDGPIDDWVKVVRKLWQDDEYYSAMSAAALAHASRLDISFEYQILAWEGAMLAAALPSATIINRQSRKGSFLRNASKDHWKGLP